MLMIREVRYPRSDTVLSKKEEIIPKIIAVDLTKRNKDSEPPYTLATVRNVKLL
jgi:NAD-dependent DNA ligase